MKEGKKPHIITLMLLSAFAAMGAVLMTPALPKISSFFGVSIGLSQLTVTSFLLHFQPSTYGILGLLPFFGTFIGSLVIIRLSKINAQFVLKLAFFLELFSSIIMFILFLFNIISLITLFVPMAFFFMGHSLLSTTAISLAMRKTHDKANGAAVVNFSSMAMPVCMTFLLGIAHIKAAFFMPLILLIALFLMASIYITMLKNSFQT